MVKPLTVEDPLQEENRTDYVASSIPKEVRLSKPPLAKEYEVKNWKVKREFLFLPKTLRNRTFKIG